MLTGTAASQNAGPALVLSMIISAVGCAFSGLCYAEFSAMVPVAGSAYTYAYATIGEFVAWIIGWDLILEYALSVATVAVGWSGYFVSLARDIGIVDPAVAGQPAARRPVQPAGRAHRAGRRGAAGDRHQAVGRHQHACWSRSRRVVLVVFVVAGASYVKRANLTPFIPPNHGRVRRSSAGAACCAAPA